MNNTSRTNTTSEIEEQQSSIDTSKYRKSFREYIKEGATSRLQRARSSMLGGELEVASAQLKKAMFLDPTYRNGIIQLAQVTAQLGDKFLAIGYLRKAQQIENDTDLENQLYKLLFEYAVGLLKAAPVNNTPKIQKNKTNSNKLPYVFIQPQRPSTAVPQSNVQLVNTEFKGNCSPAQEKLIHAVNLLIENQKFKALEQLELSLQDEENFYTRLLRAHVFWSVGMFKEGVQDFLNVEEIEPDDPALKEFLKLRDEKSNELYGQAVRFHFEGDKHKTFYYINKAIEIDANNPRNLMFRSYLYRLEQSYEKALQDIETGAKFVNEKDIELKAKLHQQLSVTYNDMGIQCMKKDKFLEAIYIFNEAVRFNPKDWGILTNRGDCFRRTKQYPKALEDYEEALQLCGERKELSQRIVLTYHDLAVVEFNKRRYDLCIEWLDRALAIEPKNASIIALKSKAQMYSAGPIEALRTLRTVGDERPQSRELTLSFNFLNGQLSTRSATFRNLRSPKSMDMASARTEKGRRVFTQF